MSALDGRADRRRGVGDTQRALVELLADRAGVEGATGSPWPGLTYFRFSQPARVHDDVVASLSIYVVVQGRVQVAVDGRSHACDSCDYFILAQGERIVADALDASRDRPVLSAALRIDPAMATATLSDIEQVSHGTALPLDDDPARVPACTSPLDSEIADTLLRFLRAVDTDVDRHIVAPLALSEAVYRLLRSEQGAALATAAHREQAGDRISAAIAFMRNQLTTPIRVEDMASHVSMSVSAFAHLFKETTGSAPYQYLKRLRFERARELLVQQNRSVSEACYAVGYGSVSHFITEFKRFFGETPRSYAARLRRLGAPRTASVPL